jgi:hypothetical protein
MKVQNLLNVFVSQLSTTTVKPEINQLIKRKHLFWRTVWEVSVHDHLSPLYLGVWQAVHCGKENVVKQSCSLQGQEQRERKMEGLGS